METRKVLVVLAVIVGLALAACVPTVAPIDTPTPPQDAPTVAPALPLNGTSWLLENLNGQSLVPDTKPTLNFENGTLNGTDGCNQFGGSYTAEGAKISVNQDLASTMMACEEPIMQQASVYLKALVQAAGYKVAGRQLTLLDAAGKTLATFTQQSYTLSGTSWTVTGYDNGRQAVVSVIAGSALTADFGADGKLSGSAGCNNYHAAYEASGKSLKIGPAATTRKMCAEPAGVMEQEMAFLKALESAATYHLDGDRLELRTAGGALAVTFTRA